MERFNLSKLNDHEVKERHLMEISNTFAALETLSDNVAIKLACESGRKYIETSAKRVMTLSV
jgi:hypothetical protein